MICACYLLREGVFVFGSGFEILARKGSNQPVHLQRLVRILKLCMEQVYTTLPHNLIKDKLIDLIERTFQREGSPYLACSDRNAFLLQKNLKNIMHGRVKMYVMR